MGWGAGGQEVPAPGWALSSATPELPSVTSSQFTSAQLVKNLPAMRETWVRSLGWEDPLEKGMTDYPLQFSGLENSMDGIVHGVTKSQTRQSDFHFHFGKARRQLRVSPNLGPRSPHHCSQALPSHDPHFSLPTGTIRL